MQILQLIQETESWMYLHGFPKATVDLGYRPHWNRFRRMVGDETEFSTHYLENSGADLKWTKEDSDLLRNTYFIIIDNAMIDLYWDKYSKLEYRWKNYNKRIQLKEITFEDWILNL